MSHYITMQSINKQSDPQEREAFDFQSRGKRNSNKYTCT